MTRFALLLITALLTAACTATPQMPFEEPNMAAPASGPDLTIERLYASPSLNGASPRGVKFSPDGSRVTFLKAREEDQSRFDLWQFDVATGVQSMLVDSMLLEPEEVELSEEEKALRERKRIAGSRGIVSYDWGTADTILVPVGGDLHLVTLTENGPSARRLTETDSFEYDARVSPDGSRVSFIRDGAVYAIELATGEETRLTPLADPENTISYGVAEFVAQEEMDRYTGYWWSPDGRYLAYTRVDESTVDIVPRFDIAAEEVTVIEQRYPRAGRPNAVVDLFVRDMQTGNVHKVTWRREDWGPATDQYLARVNWAGKALVVQAVNRDQTEIRATQHWPETLFAREGFYDEKQQNWINLNSDFMVLKSEAGNIHRQGELGILTTMENEGYRNIVEVSRDGLQPVVMLEDWAVEHLLGLDREKGLIFFTGYKDTPLERHLYAVPLPMSDDELEESGWERLPDSACIDLEPYSARLRKSCPVPARLTEAGKSWSITLSPDGKSFVGTSSSPTQPPQTGLYRFLSEAEKWDAFREAGGGAQSSDTEPCEDLAPGSAALQVYCGPQIELIAWIEQNALDERHPY
ncbi:MAG: DPP IV N-terminal domain-containing protein, partial [Hyphomonadaceae bacterium]|nr:DPP IV N-terminal domain-containing protein [Hyphomonadaceae bacterium]